MSGFEELASKIQGALGTYGAEEHGPEIRANCPRPGCGDIHKHLYVNLGKRAFYCQKCSWGRGMKIEELAQALGIPVSPGRNGTGREVWKGQAIIAVYSYYDADGAKLFEVCRTDGKEFPARRPDGKWTLADVKRVPFRLPQLLAAEPSQWVYVPEGEKDVLTLALMLGQVATCNPGGAGKWRDEYSPYLKGRHVVVLVDNDGKGRQHGQQVAASVWRHAASVRILDLVNFFELPEKGDVSDAFEQGLTANELQHLAEETPLWQPPEPKPTARTRYAHAELMRTPFPKKEWVIDGLVLRGGLTFLGGKKKRGKSRLGLQFAQGVASGSAVLGRKTLQGSVAMLTLEDGPTRIQERLTEMGATPDLPITYIFGFTALNEGGLDELARLIGETKPLLLIIDTLASATTGKIDPDKSRDMADLGNALRIMAQGANCAILVIAHHGKHTYDDPGDDLRGSSALGGASDVNLGLYRTDSGHTLKAEGKDIADVELRIFFDAAVTWSWQLLGDARDLARQEADRDVQEVLVQDLHEADAGAIARALGKKRQSITPTLNRLVANGTIERTEGKTAKGRKAVLYRCLQEK